MNRAFSFAISPQKILLLPQTALLLQGIFIFDFDNKLIFSGISGWFSDIDEADFEFILYPFNESTELDNYDTLIKYISTENIDADVYINIDKKIKVIIIN